MEDITTYKKLDSPSLMVWHTRWPVDFHPRQWASALRCHNIETFSPLPVLRAFIFLVFALLLALRTCCKKIDLRCLNVTSMQWSFQWRHDERDGISNHQLHNCLLNRLFRHRSKKTPKLRITGLCEGNSPVTGASMKSVSIWWRHHVICEIYKHLWSCPRSVLFINL